MNEETKISPTVGRIVYYKKEGRPVSPAIITSIRSMHGSGEGKVVDSIDLCVFDSAREGSIFYVDVKQGQGNSQWDWMPYQKEQAKKAEEVESTEETIETAPQATQEPEAGKETEDGEGKPTE